MIIVTGGAGFIGSALIWKLNSLGVKDIIVVDDPEKLRRRENLVCLAYAKCMDRDEFLIRIRHRQLKEKIETVFHLGAISSTLETSIEKLYTVNTYFTKVLAEWALEHDIRMIYASSGATYGDGSQGFSDSELYLPYLKPLNPYGQSKHAFDLLARERGWLKHIVGFKFFNVYGPNEYFKKEMVSVVYKSFLQIQNGGQVELFKSEHPSYKDGEQVRDFVYVKDCVDIMIWFGSHRNVGGIYNVGSGIARTWIDLSRAVFQAMGRRPYFKFIELPEALKRNYQYRTCADLTKLRASGCPSPKWTLEAGISDYVINYLDRGFRQLSF